MLTQTGDRLASGLVENKRNITDYTSLTKQQENKYDQFKLNIIFLCFSQSDQNMI